MTTLVNRVPAEPFVPVIVQYLEAQDDLSRGGGDETHERFDGPALLLAESLGVHRDTLRWILRGRAATIDFDVVDRLMCITGKIDDWINDQIYLTTPLPEGPKHHAITVVPEKQRCAAKGCSNDFETKKKHGGKDQRFCSERCRQRGYDRRKREGEGRKPRFSNPNDTCVHGHDWTPENTYMHGTPPRRKCRSCILVRNEKARQRRRAS